MNTESRKPNWVQTEQHSSKTKFENRKKSVTLSWPTGSLNLTKLTETESKLREITKSRTKTKKTIEINTKRNAIYQTKFKTNRVNRSVQLKFSNCFLWQCAPSAHTQRSSVSLHLGKMHFWASKMHFEKMHSVKMHFQTPKMHFLRMHSPKMHANASTFLPGLEPLSKSPDRDSLLNPTNCKRSVIFSIY